VDILQVREIRGWRSATPIPNTPDYLLGVTNLRGAIVPVVDLRIRFRLPQATYTATTVLIVLNIDTEPGTRLVGVVVDAVSDVYGLAPDQVKPAPELGDAIGAEFVRGLATVQDRLIVLLDIGGLVNAAVLDTAAREGETHD
jgi:purine-binding chemotaxis protein CheW